MNRHPLLEGHHTQGEREGYLLVYRYGKGWVAESLSGVGAAAVTLAADADTLLSLSGQELGLDTQTANTVLAGPTSGGAADPAFRALVDADLPLHGAAEHDNVTRSIYISASEFDIHSGTPDRAVRGTAGATLQLLMWAFDGTADEYVATSILLAALPGGYAGGVIAVKPYWAPSDATAGNVRWFYRVGSLAAGDQIDEAALASVGQNFASPAVAEQLEVDTFTTDFTPTNATDLLRFIMGRQAANAGDTYDALDAWLAGVELTYTATQ